MIFLYQSIKVGKKKSPPPGGGDFREEKKEPAAAYFPPVWSIIGAGGLDFRVRNGNGYCPSAMATGTTITIHAGEEPRGHRPGGKPYEETRIHAGGRIWPGLTAY